MTTAATSLLGLALPVTGELQGTWGTTVNDSITSLLDTAVAGTTTLSTDGDVTLSTTTLAANQARQAILLCSGARTAQRTITAPAQSKIYTIINATTGGYAVKLVGVGPTTGLTIPNGASAVVAWNGSDFIEIGSSTIGNLTVNGNLTVTGTSTLTGAATLTANPTLSGGTANGVAYLNGSKVVTTGSALTFDGTNLGVSGNNAAHTTYLTLTNNSTAGYGPKLDFNIGYAGGYTSIEFQAGATGTSGGYLQIFAKADGGALRAAQFIGDTYTGWSVGGSEQMRLTSTGLGIGTSSPAAKLHVSGSAAKLYVDLGGNNYYQASNQIWQNYGGGTEYMRLDSSGNLGLGVTPSAWGSVGGVAFDMKSYGTLNTFDDGTKSQVQIGYNYYQTSTSVFNYKVGDLASMYRQRAGVHSWYNAASGTAGTAITFTQAMTLDASGRQLVGYTSSVGTAYQPNVQVKGTTSSNYGAYGVVSSNNEMLGFMGIWSNGENSLWISADPDNLRASSNIVFSVDATERARIDSSGNLLVGTTSSSAYVNANSTLIGIPSGYTAGVYINHASGIGSGNVFMGFGYNAGQIGSITQSGTTAVAYNTSSDYRLKHDIAPMTGALAKVAALNPVTYKWNADNSDGEGFIAHELAEVCPHAVTGEKDAVDEEGNPVYQGIDTSFLVATLTAAIKEQQALIQQLQADVAALKGN